MGLAVMINERSKSDNTLPDLEIDEVDEGYAIDTEIEPIHLKLDDAPHALNSLPA